MDSSADPPGRAIEAFLFEGCCDFAVPFQMFNIVIDPVDQSDSAFLDIVHDDFLAFRTIGLSNVSYQVAFKQ